RARRPWKSIFTRASAPASPQTEIARDQVIEDHVDVLDHAVLSSVRRNMDREMGHRAKRAPIKPREPHRDVATRFCVFDGFDDVRGAPRSRNRNHDIAGFEMHAKLLYEHAMITRVIGDTRHHRVVVGEAESPEWQPVTPRANAD